MKRAFLALALMLAAPAAAVLPDEMLPDAAQEARARAISKDLRCVVCQNQSIDDSDAPLARDLRVLVSEQFARGSSDAEVRHTLARDEPPAIVWPDLPFGVIANEFSERKWGRCRYCPCRILVKSNRCVNVSELLSIRPIRQSTISLSGR